MYIADCSEEQAMAYKQTFDSYYLSKLDRKPIKMVNDCSDGNHFYKLSHQYSQKGEVCFTEHCINCGLTKYMGSLSNQPQQPTDNK
jgi:hypothetical protein